MCEVHFIGEIEFAVVDATNVSVTWAIVPGNIAWVVRNGLTFGETQICTTSAETGRAVLNHPIDIHFETTSSEGWPYCMCEVSGNMGFCLSCNALWC